MWDYVKELVYVPPLSSDMMLTVKYVRPLNHLSMKPSRMFRTCSYVTQMLELQIKLMFNVCEVSKMFQLLSSLVITLHFYNR